MIYLFFRHQHHSQFLLAIHLYYHRLAEMYMPQVFRLVYGRLYIQEFLIVYAVVHKGVDGKVSHSEGGLVLVLVGWLAGV